MILERYSSKMVLLEKYILPIRPYRYDAFELVIKGQGMSGAFVQTMYCAFVKDDERIWRSLAQNRPSGSFWHHYYMNVVTCRPEIARAINDTRYEQHQSLQVKEHQER